MKTARGFTLIEMIMAMVMTGILAGIVAIFITKPVEGYIDTANRAALTDMADLALKRMALEIRTAVPNTVRVGASNDYVEFIPATGSGRYCTDLDTCTNKLTHFVDKGASASTSATVSFDVLGPAPTPTAGDQIIIYNTGQTGLDAYNNDNCATFSSGTSTVTFTDTPFPYSSPTNRFFIAPASGTLKFACAANQLTRAAGAGFCGLTLTTASALLVKATTLTCNFKYETASAVNGLLTLTLTLGNAGGSVTLSNQIHVDNTP